MRKIDLAQDFDISIEMLDILTGKMVGEGNTRIVYDCPLFPGHVIKIEKENDSHDNIMEYQMWSAVVDQKDKAKWLAPCKWLSNNGRILIQKKVTHISNRNEKNIPLHIPAFLTDMQYGNYGFIGKQFVCFDYAFSPLICMSDSLGKRMIKFKPHTKY